MHVSLLPLELRSLRSILQRLSETCTDAPIGPTVSDWCRREGLHLRPDTATGVAVTELVHVFFERASKSAVRV